MTPIEPFYGANLASKNGTPAGTRTRARGLGNWRNYLAKANQLFLLVSILYVNVHYVQLCLHKFSSKLVANPNFVLSVSKGSFFGFLPGMTTSLLDGM